MIINQEEFIAIPRGEYRIGLPESSLDRVYERARDGGIRKDFLAGAVPVHTVTAGPVLIRKYLTTGDEYSEFTDETGYRTEAEREGWGWVLHAGRWHKREGVDWKRPFGPLGGAIRREDGPLPVMQVTWNDAVAYCSWLAEKNGREIRLPREAEWEIFAVRCGVEGATECAGERAPGHGPDDFLAAVRCALRAGARCGTGIVWEWTGDWYDRYPGGPDSRDYGRVYRVLRGGSIMSHPVQRSREFRLRKCPTARSPYYGFRIAIQQ